MFSIFKRLQKVQVTNKTRRRQSVETHLIDKDLQSILKPLNLIQALFLCAKYKIRDDIVTANNICYSIVSFVIFLIINCTYAYSFSKILFLSAVKQYSQMIKFGFYTKFVSSLIGSFLNYYTNVSHRRDNVLLISKIQRAQSILKTETRNRKRKLGYRHSCK